VTYGLALLLARGGSNGLRIKMPLSRNLDRFRHEGDVLGAAEEEEHVLPPEDAGVG